MKPVLKFKEVQDLILYELYWFFNDPDSPDAVEPEHIKRPVMQHTSGLFIDEAIDLLVSKTFIRDAGVLPREISITAEGISYVENELEHPLTFLAQQHEEILATGRPPTFAPSGAADTWDPLPIERGAPEYQRAVSALEETVETVRGDNGYASSVPEEHSQVLASLSTGLEWIKNKLPSRTQVKSLILDTLNFLQQKFSGAVIGEVASRAAKAVVDWLKSLVL